MSISKLTADGEPQWPAEPERLAAQTKSLDRLLSLPKPSRPAAQRYQRIRPISLSDVAHKAWSLLLTARMGTAPR